MDKRILKKLGATIIEIGILIGGICMFLCFEYYLKWKMLFVIAMPFILFDLFCTWIPQKALSRGYRKQIKEAFLCRWNLKEYCIEEKCSLLPEEIAVLCSLCEKYPIDFSDEHVELSGIGFRFPLDQFCWCLCQAKNLPDHYFIQWEHNDWPPTEAIVLNTEEQKKIGEIISKYNLQKEELMQCSRNG